MAEVTLTNVRKNYNPDLLKDTLRNINLDIKDGEFIVFVGPSGCGKSTLLRMIAGLEDITDGVLKIVYNLADNDAKDEEWGSETNNYDFSIWSGWGPDYADPNTYMHTFAKDDGDSLVYLGFEEKEVTDVYKTASGCETVAALKELVLGEYDALYKAAASITDVAKTEQRYEAFALAEYNLIFESAIIAPWFAQSGYYATVSNTIAWQAGRASYGLTGDKFKNVVVANEVITKALKQALTDEYEAGKAA